MTLTTAATPARLRSTPQKYKLFLTLIQINRFFYRKTSLPHQPSSLSPPTSAFNLQPSAFVLPSSFIHQPSYISLRSSLLHLPSYFIKHISLQPSNISHLSSSILPLTSSINHHTSAIILQPSAFSHHTSFAFSPQPSTPTLSVNP